MKLSVLLIFLFLNHSFAGLSQAGHNTNKTSIDTTNLDFKELANHITGSITGDYEKAKTTLEWVSGKLTWLSTDYKLRTTKEILARGGGNCFELAKVYMELINVMKINYRPIAEINLHICSDTRQHDAEERVRISGNRASVFGQCHNDHRWVEIYDAKNNEWQPVDPSMNVIGTEQWLKARVAFGERITTDTSITNDMIVPFAIFVTGNNKFAIAASRTRHYLVDKFNSLYKNKLQALPSWQRWLSAITGLEQVSKAAFEGQVNLHQFSGLIEQLSATYSQLKKEYLALQ